MSSAQQTLAEAWEHHRAGRLTEAEERYRQVLARQPDDHRVLHMLAVLLHQRGKSDEAIGLIRRAIELNSKVAAYHNDHALILRSLRRADDALAALDRALAIDPNYINAIFNRAGVLCDLGRKSEAVAVLRRTVNIKPGDPQLQFSLALLLQDLGRLNEAAEAYDKSLSIKPDLAPARNNLGNTLASMGEVDQGIAELRQAVRLQPDRAMYHSNLLHLLHFHPDYNAKKLFDEHRAWAARHADHLLPKSIQHDNAPSPDRRLKIGYLSPDLREHVVGWNLLPLLRNHDHDQFEVICYSTGDLADATTAELRSHSDAWHEVAGLDDAQLAHKIREGRIDVLVDLSLHSAGNRLLVFARKPAAVQITYLGYCSTSGMSAVDYRFSDPQLDPADSDLSCYSEQTIRLAETYWCYEPGGTTPQVQSPPFESNGFVTFGCLNSFSKVSASALETWAQILSRTPRSRLIIHAQPDSRPPRVWQALEGQGVLRDRVEFVARQPWEQYIRQYQSIDIALDPFPYAGGITTCDALWMGVPVVTLSGKTAVGRAGRSILSNVGLPELIARDPHQYVELAASLAADPPRMRDLRRTLRERMQASPMRHAKHFARRVEAGFRDAWRRWCSR